MCNDENEVACKRYGLIVRGINLFNVLYHSGEASIPVAFEVINKTAAVLRRKY